MDCSKFQEKIYLFLDHELNEADLKDFRKHIADCDLCRLQFGNEQKFHDLLIKNLRPVKAPYLLQEKILKAIKPKFSFSKLTPVLKSALAILLFVICYLYLNRPAPVFDFAFAEHIRTVHKGLKLEFESNNLKQVRDWLQAKLEWRVMVPRLSQNGFELKGAAIRKFRDKKVSYLIYQKPNRTLSVLMFDASGLKIRRSTR